MIEEFALKYNLPKFRSKQFFHHYYQEVIDNFEQITTWPKDLREKLIKEVPFMDLDVDKEFISKKRDTHKVLFTRKKDGQRIETVLMKHKDGRNTVCVSCMVGCPVNCSFCATGKMGFGGNLSDKEIVDQIMYFQRILKKENEKVTNVVFMGMGEPMLNLPRVQKAIDVMIDPEKLGMSSRRITISTSGYITQFKKLVKSGFRGKLAISLHAPNQDLRAKMMPVAKLFPLNDLMEAIDDYTAITNKRVSYEYILIKNVNDTDIHAMQLIELLSNRMHHINLIPYNPISEVEYRRSSKEGIRKFTRILDDYGMNYTIRITMGDDVNAACGQLADRENKMHVDKRIVTPSNNLSNS